MAEVTSPPAEATDKAQQVAGQVGDKAQELAGEAKEKAQQAAGDARGRVREQVEERSTRAGEQVSGAAGDLRSVGEELRKQGKDTPAKLAEQAAERTERLGSYLTGSSADRILSDVEDLARRQPWAVVAGGLALGFAASRLLKASSTQRYQQRSLGAPQAASPASNGNGARTDREIGGPTAPLGPAAPLGATGMATGGAPGTRPTGLDPHR
jgi:ElaB/YqjD/DUF883 family membrane-anchored ribosome-binding protein